MNQSKDTLKMVGYPACLPPIHRQSDKLLEYAVIRRCPTIAYARGFEQPSQYVTMVSQSILAQPRLEVFLPGARSVLTSPSDGE